MLPSAIRLYREIGYSPFTRIRRPRVPKTAFPLGLCSSRRNRILPAGLGFRLPAFLSTFRPIRKAELSSRESAVTRIPTSAQPKRTFRPLVGSSVPRVPTSTSTPWDKTTLHPIHKDRKQNFQFPTLHNRCAYIPPKLPCPMPFISLALHRPTGRNIHTGFPQIVKRGSRAEYKPASSK